MSGVVESRACRHKSIAVVTLESFSIPSVDVNRNVKFLRLHLRDMHIQSVVCKTG